MNLIFDYHGTLGDDVCVYGGLLDVLSDLSALGGIFIFSNATIRSSDAEKSYLNKGLIKGKHYHNIMTSGDIFYEQFLLESNYIFFKVFDALGPFAQNLDRITTNINGANFIYISVPEIESHPVFIDELTFCGNKVSLSQIVEEDLFQDLKIDNAIYQMTCKAIDDAVKHNKNNLPFVLANPDLSAVVRGRDALRQGFFGAYLCSLGQEVIYCGKPIKDSIERFMRKAGINLKNDAYFFGDNIYTDMIAGNLIGASTILCSNEEGVRLSEAAMQKVLSFMKIGNSSELTKHKVVPSLKFFLENLLKINES